MSLEIDPDKVAAALLADGWHACVDFDFSEGGLFEFREADEGDRVSGPMSSILAVRENPPEDWPADRGY